MKWNSIYDKHNYKLSNWHKKFCWLPHQMYDTKKIIWLEFVERKGNYLRGYFGEDLWIWFYQERN